MFQELEIEIDQCVNKLVIDYLASLLTDGPAWEEMMEECDQSLVLCIKHYIQAIRIYTQDKIALHKVNRQEECDYLAGNNKPKGKTRKTIENDLNQSTIRKNGLREKLIEYGINYKKYHKCRTY